MPPSIQDCIHLVSTSPAAGHVLTAGGKRSRIRYASSCLTIGPCDVEPDRHVTRRRAWEAERPWPLPLTLVGLEELAAAIAGDGPVAVWATHAFQDLVWLWWALDGLQRLSVDPRRLFVVRPHVDGPFQTVGGTMAGEGRAAFETAVPIVDEVLVEGAVMWSRYASTSPLAFDEARRRGSRVFPELTVSAEIHGAWFPRLDGERLFLSRLDEVLLGRVGDSACTSGELLDGASRELLEPFDGFFPIERLRAWASHGVLARETHSDRDMFRQDSFRLNERTRRLLAEGLERVDDAPPIHVGGCLVNDPTSPWVRVGDGDGWRLVARASC